MLRLNTDALPNRGLKTWHYDIRGVYVLDARVLFLCFHPDNNPLNHWDIVDLENGSFTFLGEFYNEAHAKTFLEGSGARCITSFP